MQNIFLQCTLHRSRRRARRHTCECDKEGVGQRALYSAIHIDLSDVITCLRNALGDEIGSAADPTQHHTCNAMMRYEMSSALQSVLEHVSETASYTA
jgi:hypothetical protein